MPLKENSDVFMSSKYVYIVNIRNYKLRSVLQFYIKVKKISEVIIQ